MSTSTPSQDPLDLELELQAEGVCVGETERREALARRLANDGLSLAQLRVVVGWVRRKRLEDPEGFLYVTLNEAKRWRAVLRDLDAIDRRAADREVEEPFRHVDDGPLRRRNPLTLSESERRQLAREVAGEFWPDGLTRSADYIGTSPEHAQEILDEEKLALAYAERPVRFSASSLERPDSEDDHSDRRSEAVSRTLKGTATEHERRVAADDLTEGIY